MLMAVKQSSHYGSVVQMRRANASMTIELPFSQACENNQEPILERLREVFEVPAQVLEIGTGTGQHAVHFARALSHLQWQPSDHPEAARLALLRLEQAALPNILPMIELDVGITPWPVSRVDGAFSANTAHIMAWSEVEQMFHGIGERLTAKGSFCLYGPFNEQGQFSSDSNRQFDQQLRARAPHMGIRDLDNLQALAIAAGLILQDSMAMPANNKLLVFRSAATPRPNSYRSDA